jgi:ubiquinone/menaquinone biosynthesis C-methylase UbiE
VGCGNGWFSGKLAALKNSAVTGADINKTELNQAKRVFSNRSNLCFAEGDLESIEFDKKFDAIIFAASIQYFPFFDRVMGKALSLLNRKGEIHILDSHFYHHKDLEGAKQRSQLYYKSIGCNEMAGFYFHHSLESLRDFNYKLLFNPFNILNRAFGKKDPFLWICIST